MKTYKTITQLLVITLLLTPSISFSRPVKHFGRKHPFKISDLPASQAKTKLLALSAARRKNALAWLHRLSFDEHDLKYLKIDSRGGVFYSDTFLVPKKNVTKVKANAVIAAPAISATQAFSLHSKPGASNIIYLDFDGHQISNTAWNDAAHPLYSAKAYDTDGNLASFSPTELTSIAEIWHRIAEDYAPFNVDVTTELPTSFGPTVGRILVTHSIDNTGKVMPSSTGGGVAYVKVWSRANYASFYSPALVYYDHLGPGVSTYIAEAASHEMGHNMGLNHDGTATVAYYAGQGTGFVSWAPIMGVGYYNNVTEWSKGEYTGANNIEDDLSIISSLLAYRTDDHSNSSVGATALAVAANGAISVTNPETDPDNTVPDNKGIIETRTDVDYFSFNAGAGALQLTVNPAWDAFKRADKRGANLDIQATLYQQNGAQLLQVAQVDPSNDTNAVINKTVTAGTYFLAVAGVGNNTTPYSDYASLGQYFIAGSIPPTNTILDTTAPTPNPMSWLVAPNATGSSTISMQATVASDDSDGSVQYLFSCVLGGLNCVDSGWRSSNQYTATGLAANTSYSFQVKAKDTTGNETAFSTSASAITTNTLPVPGAPNLSGLRTTATTAKLTWSAVNNAASYDVWRCTEQRTVTGTVCNYGSSRFTFTTGTSYNDTVTRSRVRYKLKALNASAIASGFSNEIRL